MSLGELGDGHKIKHLLLISLDGLHALDVARFVESHPNSAQAELSGHGVTYSNARPPANSDSFPGLLALVTGGSPISHGMFYDVSCDRASPCRAHTPNEEGAPLGGASCVGARSMILA
jgi:hypothetical protein